MAKLKKNNETAPRFSENTLKFISKASRQKSATWLDKNRDEYEAVLVKPLQALAAFLANKLSTDAKGYHFPLKGIGRIKRPSNRVDEDRGLYKDWISYSVSRPAKSRFESNPNLYFMIHPDDPDGDQVLVAGGLYMPSSAQMRAIRESIAADPAPFEKLFASKGFAMSFKGGFSKDKTSSRFPRGFDQNHPRIDWIKLQAFFVWKPYPKRLFISPKFAEQVAADWKQILRLNELLESAIRKTGQKSSSLSIVPGAVSGLDQSGLDQIEAVEQRKYDF